MRGGQNRVTAAEHRRRGTFRRDRAHTYAASPGALQLVREVLDQQWDVTGAELRELCELYDRTTEAFAAYVLTCETSDDAEAIRSAWSLFTELRLALLVRLDQHTPRALAEQLIEGEWS